MKYKNKKHKKSNRKTTDNKIKRRIFVVIKKNNKKHKKHFKIKKIIKKIESFSEPEEFDNISTFFFHGSSPLNTENKNEKETKQSQNNIIDIYDCDFEIISNIKTNIHKINSVESKYNTNFCD